MQSDWYGSDSIDYFGTPGQWLPKDLDGLDLATADDVHVQGAVQENNMLAAPPPKVEWSKLASTLREKCVKTLDAPLAAPSLREADRPGNTLCSFYMSGELCRYGEFCKFRHVKPEPWAVEYFERLLTERLGEKSVAIERQGGDSGGGGGAGVEATRGNNEFAAASEAWQLLLQKEDGALLRAAIADGVCDTMDAAEVALGAAERGMSREVECGICLEVVVEAPGRRFGLLTGCSHAFCLDCIRAWRARIDLPVETVRSCPVCRTLSYFVIPCARFVVDGGRKAAINSEYTRSQKVIPCRHWDLGRGKCPFGTSCHYAHLLPDGQPAPLQKHSFLINADGEVKGVGKQKTIADFLFK